MAAEATGEDGVVRAAGGLVWRLADGGVEVVMVRRPKYGDWSLPKGKLDPGESWQQAAVREVGEETGLSVAVGEYLGQVEYPDPRAARTRRKVVRYWAMRALGGTFTPHAEIDAIRWLPGPGAAAALTYERDRALVRAFLAGRR
jgi:8-oxo-dGTP diphosphatase